MATVVSQFPQAVNYDILFGIISCSDSKEIARFMCTCRALYRSGARLILSKPVFICAEEQVVSFHHFMFAQGHVRFPFLTELCLYTSLLSESAVSMLTEILTRSSNLKTLKLLRQADHMLQSYTSLASAITALHSLTHLELLDALSTTCDMLKAMRSPITQLKLHYGIDHTRRPFLAILGANQRPEYHPIVVCAPFAPTLEELEICTLTPTGDMPDNVQTPVYPNVRRLTLEDDWPLMLPYVTCFPNLSHLCVLPSLNHEENTLETDDGFIDLWDHRERNLARGSWRHLEYFSGGAVELFLLGLTCNITRVVLAGIKELHLELLAPALAEIKPLHLKLEVRGNVFGKSEAEIPALLLQTGCSLVKDLSIKAEISKDYADSDIEPSMGHLLVSLSNLPLEEFELILQPHYNLDPTPRPGVHFGAPPDDPDREDRVYYSPPCPPAPLLPVERSLQDFDTLYYANSVLEAVPTLKVAVVEVGGPREGSKRTTRLQRNDNAELVVVVNQTEPVHSASWRQRW